MVLLSSKDNRATAIFFDCPVLINAIFWAKVLLHIAKVII
jgi:hypothetical protein